MYPSLVLACERLLLPDSQGTGGLVHPWPKPEQMLIHSRNVLKILLQPGLPCSRYYTETGGLSPYGAHLLVAGVGSWWRQRVNM